MNILVKHKKTGKLENYIGLFRMATMGPPRGWTPECLLLFPCHGQPWLWFVINLITEEDTFQTHDVVPLVQFTITT